MGFDTQSLSRDNASFNSGPGGIAVRTRTFQALALLLLIGGLAFVGASASAADKKKKKDCTTNLVPWPTRYRCRAVVEGRTGLHFTEAAFTHLTGPEATGPESIWLAATGPEIAFYPTSSVLRGSFLYGEYGDCRCGPKKLDASKGDKIGFGAGKSLECVTWTGPHLAGPETFNLGSAFFSMQPKKGALQKGRGVDTDSVGMVFDCEVGRLPYP
jgi:hypothetical protein